MKKIAMILACVMLFAAMAGCGANAGGSDAVTAPEGTPSELIAKLYENVKVELPVQDIPLDLTDGYTVATFLGGEDATGVKEATASESMMGAQAYSLVIARCDSAEAADKLADQMFNNIDTRKWICVEATEKQAVVCGDVVMFIMLDPQLGVTTDQVVEAFTTVCGGTVSRVVK